MCEFPSTTLFLRSLNPVEEKEVDNVCGRCINQQHIIIEGCLFIVECERIISFIAKNPNLLALRIVETSILRSGWSILACEMAHHRQIQYLDLRKNRMRSDICEMFLDSLMTNETIEKIYLDDNEIDDFRLLKKCYSLALINNSYRTDPEKKQRLLWVFLIFDFYDVHHPLANMAAHMLIMQEKRVVYDDRNIGLIGRKRRFGFI